VINLYEYACCGATFFSKAKPQPPKSGKFLVRVACCPKCQRPVRQGTGQTRKHYSLRELL